MSFLGPYEKHNVSVDSTAEHIAVSKLCETRYLVTPFNLPTEDKRWMDFEPPSTVATSNSYFIPFDLLKDSYVLPAADREQLGYGFVDGIIADVDKATKEVHLRPLDFKGRSGDSKNVLWQTSAYQLAHLCVKSPYLRKAIVNIQNHSGVTGNIIFNQGDILRTDGVEETSRYESLEKRLDGKGIHGEITFLDGDVFYDAGQVTAIESDHDIRWDIYPTSVAENQINQIKRSLEKLGYGAIGMTVVSTLAPGAAMQRSFKYNAGKEPVYFFDRMTQLKADKEILESDLESLLLSPAKDKSLAEQASISLDDIDYFQTLVDYHYDSRLARIEKSLAKLDNKEAIVFGKIRNMRRRFEHHDLSKSRWVEEPVLSKTEYLQQKKSLDSRLSRVETEIPNLLKRLNTIRVRRSEHYLDHAEQIEFDFRSFAGFSDRKVAQYQRRISRKDIKIHSLITDHRLSENPIEQRKILADLHHLRTEKKHLEKRLDGYMDVTRTRGVILENIDDMQLTRNKCRSEMKSLEHQLQRVSSEQRDSSTLHLDIADYTTRIESLSNRITSNRQDLRKLYKTKGVRIRTSAETYWKELKSQIRLRRDVQNSLASLESRKDARPKPPKYREVEVHADRTYEEYSQDVKSIGLEKERKNAQLQAMKKKRTEMTDFFYGYTKSMGDYVYNVDFTKTMTEKDQLAKITDVSSIASQTINTLTQIKTDVIASIDDELTHLLRNKTKLTGTVEWMAKKMKRYERVLSKFDTLRTMSELKKEEERMRTDPEFREWKKADARRVREHRVNHDSVDHVYFLKLNSEETLRVVEKKNKNELS